MSKTAREVYIEILTELVREEAPTLYLEDFLYYYNKAVSEYMKRRYELTEATQQLTDDLRFWKKLHKDSRLVIPIDEIGLADGYEYRHLLNCIVSANLEFPDIECGQKPGRTKAHKAVRMTSAVKAGIVDNVFLEPKYYRPYFDVLDNNITIYVGDLRSDISITNVDIEYIKQPAKITLTELEIHDPADPNSTVDSSQVLEFSDDIADEITKIALTLILERGQNPRTQSQSQVNMSVTDTSLRTGK